MLFIRNLSPIQRIAIAEKYRSLYEKQAKENISKAVSEANRNRMNPSLPNLVKLDGNKIDTAKKLSEVAGVGKETYRMGMSWLLSEKEY